MSTEVFITTREGSLRRVNAKIPDGQSAFVMGFVQGFTPPFNEWGTIKPEDEKQAWDDMQAARRCLFAFTGVEVDGLKLFAFVGECPVSRLKIDRIYRDAEGRHSCGCCQTPLDRLKWPLEKAKP